MPHFPILKIAVVCHCCLPFYYKEGTIGVSVWGAPYQGSRLPGWAIMCVSALKWVHRSQWCIWQHAAASMVGNKWYWNWTNSSFDSQIKWCSSKRAQERCGWENQHLSLFPWISSAQPSGKQQWWWTDGICPIQALGFLLADGSIAENKEKVRCL